MESSSVPHAYAKALIAQIGGWALAILLWHLIRPSGVDWVIVVQAIGAAALTWVLRCPPWWIFINLAFTPLLYFAMRLQMPPWIWLAAFVAAHLVYWNTFRSQVPLFLTNRLTASAVAMLLSGPARVLDIGSGTGAFVQALAALRPDDHITGIESAPAPFAISWLRARGQTHVVVRCGDFLAASWAEYDLVYAFLSPAPMARVWEKASREMKPGSLLVSNSFAIPGREPDRVIDVEDRRHTRLLMFRIADTE
jgi:SAM-dependent methyltransferase